MSGMRDVAKKAGVSLSTVSVVLSNSDKYVSEDIRKKVFEAAEAVNYQMPIAKKKSSRTIAVLLPTITSLFFSNLLSGIEDTVMEKGYVLLFGDSQFDFNREKNFVHTIQKQSLDGIIIDTVCPVSQEKEYFDELAELFVDRDIPTVILERKVEHKKFSSIYIDNKRISYIATSHLIQKGYTSIAHLAGRPDDPLVIQRMAGYRQALSEYQIPYDENLICYGDFSPNSGYIAMKELLIRTGDFTAVFAANDQMAIGAMKAINSIGKRIPEDIAVVGIDNLSISSIVTPSLTTINVPTYQMGKTAAKIIMESSMKGNQKIDMICNLIVRKSTNPYANSEWELFGW